MTTATLRLLFDGGCPLCVREARFLRRLDKGRGLLEFEDITSPDFDASRYGLTPEQVHGAMHAIGGDGRVHVGMDVFRRAYRAVGLGWTIGWTGWAGFRPIVDGGYRWFARNRHRLTGRKNPCDAGACAVTPGTRARPG